MINKQELQLSKLIFCSVPYRSLTKPLLRIHFSVVPLSVIFLLRVNEMTYLKSYEIFTARYFKESQRAWIVLFPIAHQMDANIFKVHIGIISM